MQAEGQSRPVQSEGLAQATCVVQSARQDSFVSPPARPQVPSPHPGHTPQSAGQSPQSAEQVTHDSVGPHTPSGQMSTHAPQSDGHEAQVSVAEQAPSPQPGQRPQSVVQEKQVSRAPQRPSPQTSGHAPQSAAQSAQSSVTPQT